MEKSKTAVLERWLSVAAYHWGVWIVAAVFLVSALVWIFVVPFNNAPDEQAHFVNNAQFMVENGRLPVSGVDDLAQLQKCRDNGFGLVPCRYSYVVYPPVQYIGQAIGGSVFRALLGVELFQGARLVNMLYGLAYVFLLYAFLWRVTLSRMVATSLTALGSWIPQIVFVSSYVNQDAFPLAAAACAALAVTLLYRKVSTKRIAFVGVAAALVAVSKYNFFVLFPFYGLIVLRIYFRTHRDAGRTLWKDVLTVSIPVALIALPWFLRNVLLYDDILGQSFVLETMEQFHPLGIEQHWTLGTFGFLFKWGYFEKLFGSFFAYLGYFNVRFEPWVYGVIFISLVTTTCMVMVQAMRKSMKKAATLFLPLLGLFALNLLLTLQNTLVYDLQPQGRYLFPMIVPALGVVAFLTRDFPEWKKALPLYVGAMFSLLAGAHLILLHAFANSSILT